MLRRWHFNYCAKTHARRLHCQVRCNAFARRNCPTRLARLETASQYLERGSPQEGNLQHDTRLRVASIDATLPPRFLGNPLPATYKLIPGRRMHFCDGARGKGDRPRFIVLGQHSNKPSYSLERVNWRNKIVVCPLFPPYFRYFMRAVSSTSACPNTLPRPSLLSDQAR